jgi:glutathione S-transferase
MPYYTAIVTLLVVLFYFFLATRVAAARGQFKIKLPATTGDPDFERVFRVHMNTLEWMPTFLVRCGFVPSTSATR